jgi:DNA polymerase-3 subunit epsilon
MVIDFIAHAFAKFALGRQNIPDSFRYCSYTELPLLSIDLELTSLDVKQAKVTSIGWVAGNMFDVDLSSAHYEVVRASGDLNQSPVIHGLLAKDIAQGQHIKEQINKLQLFVSSHVWVFHNSALDARVLSKLWHLLALPPVTISTIDTMLMQVYVMEKTNGFVPSGEVTLGNARSYYDLPSAPEHNALDDALATLTLLFAQLHKFDNSGQCSINDLKHTRAIRTYTLGVD